MQRSSPPRSQGNRAFVPNLKRLLFSFVSEVTVHSAWCILGNAK